MDAVSAIRSDRAPDYYKFRHDHGFSTAYGFLGAAGSESLKSNPSRRKDSDKHCDLPQFLLIAVVIDVLPATTPPHRAIRFDTVRPPLLVRIFEVPDSGSSLR